MREKLEKAWILFKYFCYQQRAGIVAIESSWFGAIVSNS